MDTKLEKKKGGGKERYPHTLEKGEGEGPFPSSSPEKKDSGGRGGEGARSARNYLSSEEGEKERKGPVIKSDDRGGYGGGGKGGGMEDAMRAFYIPYPADEEGKGGGLH